MKRVFISLGLGLIVLPLMVMAVLFTWKLFWPTTHPSWLMWLMMWSYPLLCRISPKNVTAAKILISGLVGDYLLVSFLIYSGLRLRGRFLRRKAESGNASTAA
jgi:hypothetical protein